MKKINFNGCKIESNPDPRNYHISKFIPREDKITDEKFILKLPSLDVIINQTHYNACVGHSFATVKSILEYNKTNKWIDFDPFIIYGTRYDGEYNGDGMYSWQAARNLYKEGAFLRRDFNIQEEMPKLQSIVSDWKRNNVDKVEAAKEQVISGYAYVYNVSQIKRALKNGMPVSVTWPIYSSFYNTDIDGVVSLKKPEDVLEGYHQMTIVGWTTTNRWIVLNSWGTEYGMSGVYFIPFDYSFDNAIAVSDTITPSKYKAQKIILNVGSYKFYVDGDTHEFDTVPIISDDRTLVPIRFITEALGCSVEWLDTTKEVIIRSEEALIRMKIGYDNVIINGDVEYLDSVPKIINDRTMVPVRVIAEALNCNVAWNPYKREITIDAK